MKNFALIILISSLAIACNSLSEDNAGFEEKSMSPRSTLATSTTSPLQNIEAEPNRSESAESTNLQASTKDNVQATKANKIIKEGNMEIRVDDLSMAKTFIDSLMAKYEAYYEKEIFSNSEYSQNYQLKLRIPSSNFDTLIEALENGGGSILKKFINAKDVSEKYLDLEIRLKNNKAYLQRYNELLKKAESIKDMIQIQEKIRHIEQLIDQSIGKMNFINDQVRYSTLTLELTTEPKEYIAETPSFLANIVDAFKNGFQGILYFLLFLANIWPIVIFILVLWFFRSRLLPRGAKKSVV